MPQADSGLEVADACVLWLHGDEEDGRAWERLESDPMSGLGKRLPWVQWAFPTAPAGNDGRWFEYELPLMSTAAADGPSLDKAVAAVHAMLRQMESDGVSTSRIVVGGFGPGGALALLAGRTYPDTLAGIVGLSSWYAKPRLPSSDCGSKTPVLLCHGEDDDDVPVEEYTFACSRLKRDGAELRCFSYAGFGHTACATELTVLAAPRNFLTEVLPTLTPSPRVVGSRMKREDAPPEPEWTTRVKPSEPTKGMPLGDVSDAAIASAAERLMGRGSVDAGVEREEAEKLLRSMGMATGGGNGCADRGAGGMGGAGGVDGGLDGMEELSASLEHALSEAAARSAAGGDGGDDDRVKALVTQLVESSEEASRDATSCTLTNLTEADGYLHVVLSLVGCNSLADAELHVGEQTIELRLPHAKRPFVQPLPKRVDNEAEMAAKFHKKSGQLKLRLHLAKP